MARPAMGFTRSQARGRRHGSDQQAVRAGVPQPPRRGHLLRHLPKEVVQKVVDKFVMQLEAQLADRNVTIELTDEARLAGRARLRRGDGARPMARLIQSTIKTPLADDVLGRLKEGGAVRVVVEGRRDRPQVARVRVPGRSGDPEAREGRFKRRRRSGRSPSPRPIPSRRRPRSRRAAVIRAAASAPFRRSRWSAHDDRSPPGAAGACSVGRRHGSRRRDAGGREASGSRTVEEVLGARSAGNAGAGGSGLRKSWPGSCAADRDFALLHRSGRVGRPRHSAFRHHQRPERHHVESSTFVRCPGCRCRPQSYRTQKVENHFGIHPMLFL